MLLVMAFYENRFYILRGIFQGCPISPYLFVLAIEILAKAIRGNRDIGGIRIDAEKKKIVCLLCFNGSRVDSFMNLTVGNYSLHF